MKRTLWGEMVGLIQIYDLHLLSRQTTSDTAERTPANTAQTQILVCLRGEASGSVFASMQCYSTDVQSRTASDTLLIRAITTKREFRDLVDVPFAGAATSTTPSRISVQFFVRKETRKKNVQFVQEKRFLL